MAMGEIMEMALAERSLAWSPNTSPPTASARARTTTMNQLMTAVLYFRHAAELLCGRRAVVANIIGFHNRACGTSRIVVLPGDPWGWLQLSPAAWSWALEEGWQWPQSTESRDGFDSAAKKIGGCCCWPEEHSGSPKLISEKRAESWCPNTGAEVSNLPQPSYESLLLVLRGISQLKASGGKVFTWLCSSFFTDNNHGNGKSDPRNLSRKSTMVRRSRRSGNAPVLQRHRRRRFRLPQQSTLFPFVLGQIVSRG